jgi:hypothetical protein
MSIRETCPVHLFLVLALSAAACSGGSGSGDKDRVFTDEEIVALCDDLIEEIEDESDADQIAGFQQVEQNVAGYDYTIPSGPGDPGIYNLEPDDEAQLYQMHAVIAMLGGSRAAALWCALQAVRLEPDDAEALSLAGTILLQLERNEDALAFLVKAVFEDENEELHHLSLASAYKNLGKTQKALDQAKEALDLAPDNMVVKNAVMDMYMEDLSQTIRDRRSELVSACNARIQEAISLASLDEIGVFTQATQQATMDISDDLSALTMSMPMDFPMGFIEGLSNAQSSCVDRWDNLYWYPLNQELDDIQSYSFDEQDAAAVDLSNCCGTTLPCPCTCFYDYCSSGLTLHEDHTVPDSYEAMERFVVGSVIDFKNRELETVGMIISNLPELSQSGAEWAIEFEYLLLNMHCLAIAEGAVTALTVVYSEAAVINANCEMEDICRTAEEEARQAAWKQKIEEMRLAEEERIRKEALAKQKAQEDKIKGEVCLDSLGCLGIDGSKLSVKIGGPVFAQFTVDTDNLSIGARVGVGVSDPSGGNLAGADLSIGGTISTTGSSTFDIRASYSYAAGTGGGSTTLWGISSNN